MVVRPWINMIYNSLKFVLWSFDIWEWPLTAWVAWALTTTLAYNTVIGTWSSFEVFFVEFENFWSHTVSSLSSFIRKVVVWCLCLHNFIWNWHICGHLFIFFFVIAISACSYKLIGMLIVCAYGKGCAYISISSTNTWKHSMT